MPRLGFGLAEKLNVFIVRAWPSSLDIVHSDSIELLGNAQLIMHGEVKSFPLRSITQGCVV
jgi:hypothetical protein